MRVRSPRRIDRYRVGKACRGGGFGASAGTPIGNAAVVVAYSFATVRVLLSEGSGLTS